MNPFQFCLVLEASALAASLAAMKQHVTDNMQMVEKFYTKAKLNKLSPHLGTVVQHELELLNLQNEPDDLGRDRSRSPPQDRAKRPPKLAVLKKARPEY